LSVAVDISAFHTVVVVDPEDLYDLWQKAGKNIGIDLAYKKP
jgi:hypothetical protein